MAIDTELLPLKLLEAQRCCLGRGLVANEAIALLCPVPKDCRSEAAFEAQQAAGLLPPAAKLTATQADASDEAYWDRVLIRVDGRKQCS